jgi:ABC-type multidrug transport system ATPase subunit
VPHFLLHSVIGKTTLLNVIAGRANSGVIEGDVLLNGAPLATVLQSSSSGTVAYVQQDDAHIAVLTVRETLLYAAMLRLRESSPTSSTVLAAVDEVIELLGLGQIAENFIGSSEKRNISLGQLRRVTIAVEIVSRPSLIFLDEVSSLLWLRILPHNLSNNLSPPLVSIAT